MLSHFNVSVESLMLEGIQAHRRYDPDLRRLTKLNRSFCIVIHENRLFDLACASILSKTSLLQLQQFPVSFSF